MKKGSAAEARARVMRARVVGVGSLLLAIGHWAYASLWTPHPLLALSQLQQVGVGLVVMLLLASAGRGNEAPRHSGGATLLFGLIGLAAWFWVSGPGRSNPPWWLLHFPPPLVSGSIAVLAIALLIQGRVARLAIFLNLVASAGFLLLCIAHLFEARAILHPDNSAFASPLPSVLLLLLSLAALGLFEDGPLGAYLSTDPGSEARRRLLPAAILTPVASGFLLVFALHGQRLSPTLAVTVVVFVNVLVMLLLVNAVGNKVTRVVWDRQKRMEAREARVRRQGLRDSMTQLLNRRGWDAEVDAAEKVCRRDRVDACVLVVDLDGLKQVNDTRGHKEGDEYIQRAALCLRKAGRRGEPLARLGGDEFAYLVVDCDESTAVEIVARFETALRKGGVSASVGYSMRGDGTLAEAFESADAEMYRQKRARKRRRA